MSIPFLYIFFNLHTAAFMLIWMLVSALVFLICMIVTSTTGVAISLSDATHDMSWDSYLERHMTHYDYDE